MKINEDEDKKEDKRDKRGKNWAKSTYKGDEVDEKTKEMRGIKETIRRWKVMSEIK